MMLINGTEVMTLSGKVIFTRLDVVTTQTVLKAITKIPFLWVNKEVLPLYKSSVFLTGSLLRSV